MWSPALTSVRIEVVIAAIPEEKQRRVRAFQFCDSVFD
jgi:hypothetical protein